MPGGRDLKIANLGDDFASTLGTRRGTGEWTRPADLARQIGLSTPSRDVLIVNQGVSRWRFKIAKSGTFLSALRESIEILQNGCHVTFSALNRYVSPIEGGFDF